MKIWGLLGQIKDQAWVGHRLPHSFPVRLFATHGLYSLWNSPGQNIEVGSQSLLQVIFPTQESNASLLHCRQSLYQLSHKGSPGILEWVAYSFSGGSS